MRVNLHRTFRRQFQRLRPKEQQRVVDRLELFKRNPFTPQLGNHSLRGNWVGYRSIDIAGDLRAIYRYRTASDEAEFVAIGTHSQLYG